MQLINKLTLLKIFDFFLRLKKIIDKTYKTFASLQFFNKNRIVKLSFISRVSYLYGSITIDLMKRMIFLFQREIFL